MNYLNTCYTIHTSYIITHMRKALDSQVYVILMLLLGSHICVASLQNSPLVGRNESGIIPD